MHVPRQAPVTWRNRSFASQCAALDLSGRAAALMVQLSAGPGLFAALRRISARVLGRIHKARSTTQTPGAFERHTEELVALHVAGVPAHQLRLSAVALGVLVDDLGPTLASAAHVLEAIAVADQTEAAEQLAESRATTRADRQLTEGDLAEIEDRTRADIAADAEKLARCAALRRQLRASRGAAPSGVDRLHRGRVA